MTWFIALVLLGLAVVGWLSWEGWRAGRYQSPSSPAAIELAAMQRAAYLRQMTQAAEEHLDRFAAERQQRTEHDGPMVIDARWEDWR